MTDNGRLRRLEDLRPDPANANLGTKRGADLLWSSMREFGGCRSLVSTADGVVFIGNHALDAAVNLGLKPRFIETDGQEIVVVVRRDLKYGPKAVAAAIADNRSRDVNSDAWDPQVLDALQEREIPVGRYFYGTELADITVKLAKDRERFEEEAIRPARRSKNCPTCGRPWPKGKK